MGVRGFSGSGESASGSTWLQWEWRVLVGMVSV